MTGIPTPLGTGLAANSDRVDFPQSPHYGTRELIPRFQGTFRMMTHSHVFLGLTALALAASCSNPESKTQEGFGAADAPEAFGLASNPAWDEVRQITSGDLEREVWDPQDPSHSQGGIASRRVNEETALSLLGESPRFPARTSLHALISDLLTAGQKEDFIPQSLLLSPAEKLDLLAGGTPSGLPLDLLASLKRNADAETVAQNSVASVSGQFLSHGMSYLTSLFDTLAPTLLDESLAPEQVGAIIAETIDKTYGPHERFLERPAVETLGEADAGILPSRQFTLGMQEDARKVLHMVSQGTWDQRLYTGMVDRSWEFDRLSGEVQAKYAAWKAEGGSNFADFRDSIRPFLNEHTEYLGDVYLRRHSFAVIWKNSANVSIEAAKQHRAAFIERLNLARQLAPYFPASAPAWQNWGRTYADGDFRFAGSCHGASAASISVPAPLNPVLARIGDRAMLFSAADIGALEAELWATQLSGETLYAGRRCNLRSEEVEKTTAGRVTVSECRDLNPGTFHLALIELVRPGGKSFVIEGSAFEEVWNSGVKSFSFEFHPIRKRNGELVESGVPVALTEVADRDVAHRSPGAVAVVDVSATVEVNTKARPTWRYTLELDATGHIVGGEWGGLSQETTATELKKGRTGPDFIWRYRDGSVSFAAGPINPTLVNKLLECSRRTETEGLLMPGESSLAVVRCQL